MHGDLHDRGGQPEVAEGDQRGRANRLGLGAEQLGRGPEGTSAWHSCEQGDPCASVIEKIRPLQREQFPARQAAVMVILSSIAEPPGECG